MKLIIYLVATLITMLFSASSNAEKDVYLSLIYPDPSWATVSDLILLTDRRTLAVPKAKIRPPRVYIHREWKKFYKAMGNPPTSNLILKFVEIDKKTHVCLKNECAVMNTLCPSEKDIDRGQKCTSGPSLFEVTQPN
jgi:hypothetical protein